MRSPGTIAIAIGAVAATALAHLVPSAHWLITDAAVASFRHIASGELWRLLTGPLVHSTWSHAARDILVFLGVGLFYERAWGRRAWPLFLSALILPTAGVMACHPELPAYFGLSGAIHALFAAAFVVECRRHRGRPPWWVLAIAAVFGAKLVYEAATGALLFPLELGPGVQPVPVAHLVGAAVGMIIMLPPHPRGRMFSFAFPAADDRAR